MGDAMREDSGRSGRSRRSGGVDFGDGDKLLAKHGGYRQLKSFQMAQLVYDLTARFCDRYISLRSRTHDQMVQAARSGVQNIAEGSEAAATSSKMELKLTQVARASLEELKLDYEDYLRQRSLRCWDRTHPMRQDLVNARLSTVDEVAAWVVQKARQRFAEDLQSSCSTGSTASTPSTYYPEISANAILALTTVAGYLLDRQIKNLASAFVDQGGFTERMHRQHTNRRRRS